MPVSRYSLPSSTAAFMPLTGIGASAIRFHAAVDGSKLAPSRWAGSSGSTQPAFGGHGGPDEPPTTTNRPSTQAPTASCRASSGLSGSSRQSPADETDQSTVGAAAGVAHPHRP